MIESWDIDKYERCVIIDEDGIRTIMNGIESFIDIGSGEADE